LILKDKIPLPKVVADTGLAQLQPTETASNGRFVAHRRLKRTTYPAFHIFCGKGCAQRPDRMDKSLIPRGKFPMNIFYAPGATPSFAQILWITLWPSMKSGWQALDP
jgi:hypothetical protein